MIKLTNNKEHINQLVQAMNTNDEEKIKEAWNGFADAVMNEAMENMREEMAENQAASDRAVLAQRGHRQLTSQETKWYQKVIKALKTDNPKQAFIDIIGSDKEDDLMPVTIVEDVYKDLEAEHELLSVIDFQYTAYSTKWILNDNATQLAAWGKITAEITEEIESAIDVIKLDQNKLSAFAVIEQGMLDLGPAFLDAYIRRVLAEAILEGLEEGIINGTGKDQPIGLIRDLTNYDTSNGYTAKSKESVTDFSPVNYGKLVAKLSKTEKGKARKIKGLILLCNNNDYLTKIMPATTMLTANGNYANNLFPVPTKVIVSNRLADGDAVLFLKDEYFIGMGGKRNKVIQYSDEFKFLDDMRTFKVVQNGAGRPKDNTVALYLDISKIEPAYITVKDATPTA